MKIIINLGREILLLGSVRDSIMTPSETSSEKKIFLILRKNFREITFLASSETPISVIKMSFSKQRKT
jgi:hypothetical protein